MKFMKAQQEGSEGCGHRALSSDDPPAKSTSTSRPAKELAWLRRRARAERCDMVSRRATAKEGL